FVDRTLCAALWNTGGPDVSGGALRAVRYLAQLAQGATGAVGAGGADPDLAGGSSFLEVGGDVQHLAEEAGSVFRREIGNDTAVDAAPEAEGPAQAIAVAVEQFQPFLQLARRPRGGLRPIEGGHHAVAGDAVDAAALLSDGAGDVAV